jgi:formate/nitrite transporter FocA (FNT family)
MLCGTTLSESVGRLLCLTISQQLLMSNKAPCVILRFSEIINTNSIPKFLSKSRYGCLVGSLFAVALAYAKDNILCQPLGLCTAQTTFDLRTLCA